MYFYVPLSNILNAWFLHCAIFYIYINKRSKSVLHLWLHFTFDNHHVLIWFSLCERSLPPTLISSFSLYSAWSFFSLYCFQSNPLPSHLLASLSLHTSLALPFRSVWLCLLCLRSHPAHTPFISAQSFHPSSYLSSSHLSSRPSSSLTVTCLFPK